MMTKKTKNRFKKNSRNFWGQILRIKTTNPHLKFFFNQKIKEKTNKKFKKNLQIIPPSETSGGIFVRSSGDQTSIDTRSHFPANDSTVGFLRELLLWILDSHASKSLLVPPL